MSDVKLSIPPAQLDLLRKAAAVVLLGLAAWMGWNAWVQYRDSMRRDSVEAARDAAVDAAAKVISEAQQRFAAQMASAPAQPARWKAKS